MKFSVLTKDLKAAMTTIKKGMYLQSSLPICNCIRFNTAEDSVGMVGTNLETLIAKEIPADVEVDGEVCIPFKQLEACIKGKKSAKHVTGFEMQDGLITLNVSGVTTRLTPYSVTEYPVIPQIETVLTMDLATGIAKCFPFASTEIETRQMITGVHVHSKKDELVFAATDGRTLKILRTDPLGSEFAITIPTTACVAIADRFQGPVDIGFEVVDAEKTQMRVHTHDAELITKLILQEFPDYESVLKPSMNFTGTVEIELERKAFTETINTVCAMEKKKKDYSREHPVWIDLVDGVMDIRYNNKDMKVTQSVNYTPHSSTGNALMVFNPRLFMRTLHSFDTDYVTVYVKPGEEGDDEKEMGHTISPVYIGGDHNENTVLMPMKPDPPKFGTDWVAKRKEEEAEILRKAELDKAVAEMKEGSEDDEHSS